MAYATAAEVRAMDGMGDAVAYPDPWLVDAVAFATETIDTYCGTSFEVAPFTAVTSSPMTGTKYFLLEGPRGLILFPRSITSATLDGGALTRTWTLHPEGWVQADSSVSRGRLTLTGTAGFSEVAPVSIRWAARTIARQYVVDLVSRIPDRALQVQGEYGTIQIAQPGGRHGPTSLPEVNAVLSRFRFRSPSIG